MSQSSGTLSRPQHLPIGGATAEEDVGGGPSQFIARLTQLLLTCGSCERGMEDSIRLICRQRHWSGGTFWRLDAGSGMLTEVARWSRQLQTLPMTGLTGRRPPAWLGTQPAWIGESSLEDLAAQELDVWSPVFAGIVLPVHSAERLIAIMTLDGRAAQPSAHEILELHALASVLGLFCERELAVEHSREREQRSASTLDLAAIGIAHVDVTGRFLYANPQLCRMLGYTEAELLQLSVREISHPEDQHAADEMRARVRRGEIESFRLEKRYVRKDGTTIWASLTIAVRRDGDGERLYDVSIVEDITARKLAEEQVQYLATHDGLTGLPNRTLFSQLLSLAIGSATRRGTRIAVLLLDLDRFKVINDSMGHDAGDVLLREMACRFREVVRASDVLARLGGDEFVILLSEVSDPEQAAAVGRSLLSAAMRPLEIHQQECRVTASVGICLHPEPGQDDQSLMKNADLAMYAAKEEGKNTCKFYSTALRSLSAGRLAIETHLRHALEREEFSLCYQPKVQLETGAITGVEALLRWNNTQLGPLSPVQFIPVAEETGLIVPIGQWVLRTACAQAVRWMEDHLPRLTICVNISMRQLSDEDLIGTVRAALEESGLPAGLLELELTESMIMHNSDRAIKTLTEIKALGVRVAIDDFGTGYSSLAQLKRFPIDTLKVDRSFIRDLPQDAEDRAITEAIIAMAKTLSLAVVAEGVETQAQQVFLRERACDEMQGYYFSPPLPPEQLAALLRKDGIP